MATRLERRRFEPLADAPKVQGRIGEFRRLALRAIGSSDERLSYEANDWLMRTMVRECRRSKVTAVHSYEDCSLWQFEEAKQLSKACIYDMPIGYYPAWEETERELASEFSDWLPAGGLSSKRFVRPKQKRREMELADLVLVPSTFVAKTISRFHDKRIALAGYAVDSEFWTPPAAPRVGGPLRFIYVGHVSIRKGTPILLQAWDKSKLRNAELLLIGPWQLANSARSRLRSSVKHVPPCSAFELRNYYQSADVFVFPSFFEGFGLVLLEAMACGLPAIASDATAAPDLLDETTGRVLPAGDVEVWTEALRDLSAKRDDVPQMKRAAREKACQCTWYRYRKAVSNAVAAYC